MQGQKRLYQTLQKNPLHIQYQIKIYWHLEPELQKDDLSFYKLPFVIEVQLNKNSMRMWLLKDFGNIFEHNKH